LLLTLGIYAPIWKRQTDPDMTKRVHRAKKVWKVLVLGDGPACGGIEFFMA